jgi:hypothetical protein
MTMPLAEGVSARVSYKFYSSGVIAANAEPDTATDPGASGAQILRRVSASLKLGKDTYQSNEIRSDRQIADYRHGTRRVSGSVTGELSPLTYADWFEAAFRGTWEAAVALDETDLTSVAASASGNSLTFAAGDPVALGLRVGHVVRLTNASTAGDNAKNFLILAFGGSSNRTLTVHPAPVDMSADTDFDLVTVGQRLIVPSTGHVSRKLGIEIYNEDIDVARLFTENRVGGFTMQLPASGLSTIEFPLMGRNMVVLEDSDAPYFTSPTAETTTGILAAVNGLLRVNGATVGVVTGLNIQMTLSPSSDPVVGQDVVPEIFLGRANVTGQITANLQDGALIGNFTDEDEVSVLAYLTTANADSTPAMTVLLPRIKFSDADVATSGEGGQTITMPFQALKYVGSDPGVDQTTIQIVDTEAS